ncbi:MAG: PAS domain S-box protein [Gemmatimonadetes bacterium]|jgi:PAS domain S-box-containing protein|nr:PAS domain S-box protein [Gemmatimonadota bacterium]MBT5327378.1 PAS domain S-box protein [Gemmatimonadota bacterium]MBT5803332.1 PAS domain S-box protein [Gemmatimonadota bacterium]MBT6902839.1 PAS domain S-box protein [Gemmatimonadota bacterium]
MDGDDEVTRLRRRVSELQARLVALEGAEKKRLQVENELRESQKLYRALIETAFAGIGITDVEENLTFANPALGDIMGYGVDELIGINLSRFVEGEEYNRYQELTEQRLQGFRNAYETRVRRRDGSLINVLISGSPLADEDGEFIGVLTVVFDITELRRAEQELERNKRAYTDQLEAMVRERTNQLEEAQAKLIQSAKLAAVGQLAAGVAHEINNPVGVLLMKLKFLLSVAKRENLTAKAMATLDIAVEQAGRIADIVQDLLNFSRTPTDRPQSLNLNERIHSSLRLSHRLLTDRRIDLHLDLCEELPSVLGDPVEFEQVLINLLNNAVEAMADGGELHLASHAEAGQVVISLRDTGEGIEAEDLGSIFDPFFTTKNFGEGTGLGLSISYGIVQKMGGSIEVESELGSGAVFHIRLPGEGA